MSSSEICIRATPFIENLQILSVSWLQKLKESFSSLHRFSTGLRFEDWLDHYMTLMWFVFSNCWLGGSLSCWKTHLQCSSWEKELLIQDFIAGGCIHRPLNTMKLSCTLIRKTAPEHNVPTSTLHFSSCKHSKSRSLTSSSCSFDPPPSSWIWSPCVVRSCIDRQTKYAWWWF